MTDLIAIQTGGVLRRHSAGSVRGSVVRRDSDEPGERALVSVIVPAYNEELVRAANLGRIHRHLSGQQERYRFELIVVDDGSCDRTGAIADAFAADHADVRVLHHRINGNLGQALRTGFQASRGDYVVTLDCDLTYDPAYIDRLLDALEDDDAQIALASAYLDGGEVSGVPRLRLALSRSANRYLSHAVHGQLATLTCMVRAYDGELVRGLPLRCSGSEINTEILYKARLGGARVVEIPAHLDWASATRAAPGRVSSARLVRSVSSYLRAGMLFRPGALAMLLAACCAMVTALVAVGLAVIAVRDGLHEAFVDQLGLVVIGTGAAVAGAVLGAASFLARLLKHYFEELFDLATAPGRRPHDAGSWEYSGEQPADCGTVGAPAGEHGRPSVRSVGHR